MSISGERVFDREEIAIDIGDFPLTDDVLDSSLSSSMWHTSDALSGKGVLSFSS